jgi:glutathione S-transferase
VQKLRAEFEALDKTLGQHPYLFGHDLTAAE